MFDLTHLMNQAFPAGMAALPETMLEAALRYRNNLLALWGAPPGAEVKLIEPERGDKRFAAPEWSTPYFDRLKQQYLLTAHYLNEVADETELPADQKSKLRFAIRQWLDALAPSNYFLTNPEALKLAIETGGESVRQGLEHFVEDAQKKRIKMTDESQFEVGKNLAITPGAVVFRNELIELIQYQSSTAKVHSRPLLIVPPCINKYYILDLQPENSLVRYCVEQGHTVLLVSWRNIPPELGHLSFDDYLQKGVLTALEVTRSISGVEEVNALGFCVGGALLCTAMAVLAARGQNYVKSVTLLTTMLDYADPGEIGVYLDKAAIAARDVAFKAGACISGRELAESFASLRANDLVWSFVVNNYLKGKTPAAFDLLYWNGDSTNLPGPMYSDYIQKFYVENALKNPNRLQFLGESIDLGSIKTPAYVYASKEDHIVPWTSAYKTVHLLGGKSRFVLGASGHIAGVVNPASKNKRNYWLNAKKPKTVQAWFDAATSHPGSWWTDWMAWLKPFAGELKSAPKSLGSAKYKPIMAAPGSYVLAQDVAASPSDCA